jgi:Mrp family chromosome partitioning ATPase/capsular polysaccharide biosynthesis protein
MSEARESLVGLAASEPARRSIDEVFSWRSIVRHAGVIAVSVVLCLVLGALVAAYKPAKYTAAAQLLIENAGRVTDQMLQVQRDAIESQGDLDVLSLQIDRLLATRARLEAEQAGADVITTPPELSGRADEPQIERLLREEEGILQSNRKALEAKTLHFQQLVDLHDAEIASLEAQLESKGAEVDAATRELEQTRSMVERKLAPEPRLLPAERLAAEIVAEQKSLDVLLVRARGAASQARFDLANVEAENDARILAEQAKIQGELDDARARGETARTQLSQQNAAFSGAPLDTAFIQNQIEILRSDIVAKTAFERLGLSERIVPETSGWLERIGFLQPSSAALSDTQEALEAFRDSLGVSRVGLSSTILVSYTAPDAQHAADVVEQIIRVYVDKQALAGDANSSVGSQVSSTPTARVITGPSVPIRANGPGPKSILLAAAFGGLLLGLAGAFGREFIDPRIRTPAEATRFLGAEAFGLLPRIRLTRPNAADRELGPGEQPAGAGSQFPVVAVSDPVSLFAQTVRRIKVAAENFAPGGQPVTIGITSARPGEGKTTVAMNLALLAARENRRVLLIDANSYDPKLTLCIAPQATGSLLDMLHNGRSVHDSVVLHTETGLHFLANRSRVASQPAEDIWSLDVSGFIRDAKQRYDLIVFDLPALAPGPEVRSAAAVLDAILLVIAWRRTPAEVARLGLAAASGKRACRSSAQC